MSVAPAQGRVTFDGNPVTNASVQFTPQGGSETSGSLTGKSAAGDLDADGRFVLSTYAAKDGAIIGRHRVTVMANDPAQPLPGKLDENYEVEIKAGTDNQFEITLSK